MGKLSVLGAQRIKALEAMLDDQMKEEIKESQSDLKSEDTATKLALEEFGALEDFEELKRLSTKINVINERLKAKTGLTNAYKPTTHNYSTYADYKPFHLAREKHKGSTEESKIRDKYKKKKQLLWLCETLEEAKEIVGMS